MSKSVTSFPNGVTKTSEVTYRSTNGHEWQSRKIADKVQSRLNRKAAIRGLLNSENLMNGSGNVSLMRLSEKLLSDPTFATRLAKLSS